MQEETKPLLDKRKAASRLGISLRTLDSWVKAGRIAYVKLGYAVRFLPSDLEQFILQRRIA